MVGKRHTDEFLKEIAEEHRLNSAMAGQFKPNQRIAEAYGVPLCRVESWVKSARNRGILEPHTARICNSCKQTLFHLPPTIVHHHRASMIRMELNAVQLTQRCKSLARQAERQDREEEAAAYELAAEHYKAISALFTEFTNEVRARH